MTGKVHTYSLTLKWIGNQGTGTSLYTGYSRDHEYRSGHKQMIEGSSDPAFRGDPDRWNPEELLLGAVASCHKLVYLHLCHDNGVNVIAYDDQATGKMIENETGGGQFSEVTLNPQVTISTSSDRQTALYLHKEVSALCFIAQSVNFPIYYHPIIAKEKT